MKLLDEFKAFAMRGNVVDMAVGIIIGAAFGKVVSSFVNMAFVHNHHSHAFAIKSTAGLVGEQTTRPACLVASTCPRI